ncbi:hypothetical protein EYF80_021013 [Liparis tanakae]|uniref:Uncharacterized protein n=1 Tax=Liparis tanakae TaxID=230148 RepID=A0A4Z2HU26_9TELE|nr:hypothetical protein EYF80_021013 [Liparis tanakae]
MAGPSARHGNGGREELQGASPLTCSDFEELIDKLLNHGVRRDVFRMQMLPELQSSAIHHLSVYLCSPTAHAAFTLHSPLVV